MQLQTPEAMFDALVEATGLSRIVVRVVVAQVLASVGASIATARATDYLKAIGMLRERLAVLIDPDLLAQVDRFERELGAGGPLHRRRRATLSDWPVAIHGNPPRGGLPVRRVVRGTAGPHSNSAYLLSASATFGRGPAADVQILDQHVSRTHARVQVHADGSVALVDLSSRNGTAIRGARVQQCALQAGDTFQIGLAEYVYEETTEAIETAFVYLNRLSDADALPANARGAALELLHSETAEMPAARGRDADDDRRPHAQRPTQQTETVRSRMGHMSMPRTPTRDAPMQWNPDPPAPRPALVERRGGEYIKVVADRRPAAAPAAAPPAALDKPAFGLEAAGTVFRLLALRERELAGQPLRVDDRGQLRQIEGLLRPRRGADDRRQWARAPCRLSVTIGEGRVPATLLDISGGGVSISCSTLPIGNGDRLTVRVPLGNRHLGVLRTRVVRVDPEAGTFATMFIGPVGWEMTA